MISYLLEVDTQGYEISIFAGLTSALDAGAIAYIVFEFWPRGMDLMADMEGTCSPGILLRWLSPKFRWNDCPWDVTSLLLTLPLCCSWDVTPLFIDPALLF